MRSLMYIVKECKDPKTPEMEGKYYARSVSKGLVSERELAARIAAVSGHSVGSVLGVIEDILESMIHFMKLGYNVEFGDLGNFQLRVKSEGQDDAANVDANKIEKIRCRFQSKISNYKDMITFERVYALKSTEEGGGV